MCSSLGKRTQSLSNLKTSALISNLERTNDNSKQRDFKHGMKISEVDSGALNDVVSPGLTKVNCLTDSEVGRHHRGM